MSEETRKELKKLQEQIKTRRGKLNKILIRSEDLEAEVETAKQELHKAEMVSRKRINPN